MKIRKAFTLIELLVVIAIIALLLSILMPALKVAKDHAKKIHCSANLRSLSLAALLYADDNDGNAPYASVRNNTGWCGVTTDDDGSPLPENQQIEGLRKGLLWPYIETEKAWRCPAEPVKEQLRSYGMAAEWYSKYTTSDYSIDYDPGSKPGLVYRKFSQLKNSGSRFLFMDQAGYNADGYFAIWYSRPQWWNIPNYFHTGGSVNSFADGHAEDYRMEAGTVKIAKQQYEAAVAGAANSWFLMPPQNFPDSKDLQYYQRCSWGNVGW